MRVTLKNDFHNTQCKINIPKNGAELTPRQVRRIKTTLCGVRGCRCGNDLGIRGRQDWSVRESMKQSGEMFYTIYNLFLYD